MRKRLITLVTLICLLVGCDPFEYTHDIFKVLRRNSAAEIVGLTEEGQKREIVVFPSKIPGFDNVNIGNAGYFKMTIESENLKVAIIEHVNMICGGVFQHITKGVEGNKVIIVLNSLYQIKFESEFIAGGDNRIVVPFEIFDDYYDSDFGFYPEYKDNYEESRVSFYYNFENSPNDNLYRISYDEELEMITRPDDPKRRGYDFVGWYLETEGTSVFDFLSDSNKDVTNTKLYAKWKK